MNALAARFRFSSSFTRTLQLVAHLLLLLLSSPSPTTLFPHRHTPYNDFIFRWKSIVRISFPFRVGTRHQPTIIPCATDRITIFHPCKSRPRVQFPQVWGFVNLGVFTVRVLHPESFDAIFFKTKIIAKITRRI